VGEFPKALFLLCEDMFLARSLYIYILIHEKLTKSCRDFLLGQEDGEFLASQCTEQDPVSETTYTKTKTAKQKNKKTV
jgi:hypothetical protein